MTIYSLPIKTPGKSKYWPWMAFLLTYYKESMGRCIIDDFNRFNNDDLHELPYTFSNIIKVQQNWIKYRSKR